MFGDTNVAKLHFGDHRRNQDGTEAETSRDASRVNVADRALRGCAQNSMVLSAIVLGEPWHNSLTRAIVRASQPFHAWHRWQNHSLRSAEGASTWLVAQLGGAFMAVVKETCQQLLDRPSLEFVGFDLRNFSSNRDLSAPVAEDSLRTAQDSAHLFGELSLSLVAKRMVRSMFLLRRWPLRLSGLQGDEPLRSQIAAEFRADFEAWEALLQQPATAATRALLARSCFNDVVTKQFCSVFRCGRGVSRHICENVRTRFAGGYREQQFGDYSGLGKPPKISSLVRVRPCRRHPKAFHEFDWALHDDIIDLAHTNFGGIISTRAVEDCFNHQKNSRLVRSKRKYRRLEKTMGVVLAREVLERVHRYDPVPNDLPAVARAIRLPKEAFLAPAGRASLPLGKVSSTQASTPWHSSGASNWCQRDADLAMIRQAHSSSSWDRLKFAWLGCVCDGSHCLLVQPPGDRWYFARHYWTDSAVLALPAVCKTLPETSLSCCEPDAAYECPVLLSLTEFEGWHGVRYQWHCPAWQVARSPRAASEWPPAIRAFCAARRTTAPPLS